VNAISRLRFKVKLMILTAMTLSLPLPLTAQTSGQEELMLEFRHPAIGQVYIGILYDYRREQVLLPVTELFSLLEINYQSDIRNFTLYGNFISSDNPYTINLAAMQVTVGRRNFPISADDFRIGEMDFFLSPKVFEDAFGLTFTANMLHLTLGLETSLTLPVQSRLARERARNRIEDTPLLRENYPMGYPRKRALIDGAMMDYALSGNLAGQSQDLGYTLTGGFELLGGDLQGSLFGNLANNGMQSLDFNNLRWRYALRDNPFLSGIMAGQVTTSGLQPYAIRGLSFTNDPIEPRRMYETFVVDGTTEPESEVELYVNERLTDFIRADELGYYRFDVPVTYGTTRLSLRIFTPSGEIKTVDRQMQVPFTFLPKGVVSYNVEAGVKEPFEADTLKGQIIAHGNIGYGLSRWLTASAGVEHIGDEFNPEILSYYGSLSARIARQYLLNLDLAPNAFYRMSGSVMYTNNLSLNFIYTKFDGPGMFNARNATEEVAANIYLPFSFLGLVTGLRLGGEHIVISNSTITNYRADLNARLGRLNLRVNFRDNVFTSGSTSNFGDGTLTTALTYTLSRAPGVPVYVRGMFIRGQVQYNIHSNKMHLAELQLSRTVFKSGRLNLGAGYNFTNNSLDMQFGLTVDLNMIRLATTINAGNETVMARQGFLGSIGWDAPNRFLNLSNRQQAGQSAVSVLQFIDNNNSGTYEQGEPLLPYRGVTLDRTTAMQLGRDSILRLNQLQSYHLYNLSVNRNAIGNPTLVPLKTQFSFITDPNQHKRIEIPFYRGGVIEGTVMIKRNGQQYGQGGLRLIINGKSSAFEQTIRSFSDGRFYAMDIPPGTYTISVDPAQLGFLNAKQSLPLEFTIRALSEGEYIEGLEILLITIEDEAFGSSPKSSEVGYPVTYRSKSMPPALLGQEYSHTITDTIDESKEQKQDKPEGYKHYPIEYRIQIISLSAGTSALQVVSQKFSIPIEQLKENRYKGNFIYTIGSYSSSQEAHQHLPSIRTRYGVKDAFVVAFKNNERLPELPR